MYGDIVIENVYFYGSVHIHCVWRRMQHAAQIQLGSAYVAMRPRACFKVGCRTQCEQELYTADRVDAGCIVSDVGIGYQPCHFLDI